MERCPYFHPAIREIALLGVPQPMRVSACRCLLVEQAVQRLLTVQEGQELADALASVRIDNELRPILGPDLDGISAPTCTRARLTQKCRPGFALLLNPFYLDTTLPIEEGSE